MAYNFNFNLTKISRSLFKDIARFSKRKNIHKRLGETARYLVEKFKLHEITGLPVSDAIMVVEDLIDTYVKNLTEREKFLKTRKRALFLPHCSRKYMDSRCKAIFDKKTSSYKCMHCSPDCKINKATKLGKEKGYDVYILPGGSCIKKILQSKKYEGIVGVACTEELKLGYKNLSGTGIASQGIPLLKNGCSDTNFSLKTLKSIL